MTARLSNKAIAADEARQGAWGWCRSVASIVKVEMSLFTWWLFSALGVALRGKGGGGQIAA
jgi:hypothetical protein